MIQEGPEEKASSEGERKKNKESIEKNPSENDYSEDREIQEINLLEQDEIIKIPHRFNIMMILYNNTSIGFTLLRKILKLTPGNLDHHLKKLKELEWVKNSTFFSYRPLSVISITEKGRDKFKKYVQELQELLHQVNI
ncbi:MAG: ArsR family transcriptional regulator [Promethearchaeota archaeon]|nr:MAG: ArsR family transcriptional regulator [Candidatus Lokiarchaeota archaeon]